MIVYTNDKIIITPDEKWYNYIKSLLTFKERDRTVYLKNKHKITVQGKTKYIFELDKDENMYIPFGLNCFLNKYFEGSVIKDKRNQQNKFDTSDIVKNIKSYYNILPGITLREPQILACWKILKNKRGITQLATGSGKTEILCAISKMLQECNNGIMPTVLILEPTIKLVTDTRKRFQKYGIDAIEYSKNREIIANTVNIAHPSSLGNDLEKNPNLLQYVDCLFADETHHLRSESWRKPIINLNNCSFFVGVSASAIDQSHVGSENISDYTFEELLTIGACGQILLNITTGTQVESEALATPCLGIINTDHTDIELKRTDDWHEIQDKHLQSENRIKAICETAGTFSKLNRKVLILCSQITFARLLCSQLYIDGYDSICAFGGNKFEIHGEQKIKDMNDFEQGNVNILLGSSCMIEGVDIKNLDVLILAVGGKSERIQTQSVGRVLRKTKNGKYAYIIDMQDEGDKVLNNQFKQRMKRYKEIMEIPQDRIFNIDKDNIEKSIIDGMKTLDDL